MVSVIKGTEALSYCKCLFLLVWVFLLFLIPQTSVFSDEIYIKNGDRISGEITEQTDKTISIITEAAGSVSIDRSYVDHVETTKDAESKDTMETIWDRKISIGYNRSSGNTKDSQLSTSLSANRKRERVDEITLKGEAYYSSSNSKMDAQKWFVAGRYAFSFGKSRGWYNFYKLEIDHDRFANIDHRSMPTVGFGYWFCDSQEFKFMVEAAVGLERTDYRNETSDSEEAILATRAFFEGRVFGDSKISQDLYIYPILEDLSAYRLHSETVFTAPIADGLFLKTSLLDDYNSTPAVNTEKNDLRLITSIEYSF